MPAAPPKNDAGCKICCACPAERRVRDECVIFNSPEQCAEQFTAFYDCLGREGFTQDQIDSLKRNARR